MSQMTRHSKAKVKSISLFFFFSFHVLKCKNVQLAVGLSDRETSGSTLPPPPPPPPILMLIINVLFSRHYISQTPFMVTDACLRGMFHDLHFSLFLEKLLEPLIIF